MWRCVTTTGARFRAHYAPGIVDSTGCLHYSFSCRTSSGRAFTSSGRERLWAAQRAPSRFSMDGTAHSTYLRNRIGFCVLHPMSCAGKDCVVEHVDGSLTQGVFPAEIAPHQPFRDIRAITHEVTSELQAEVRMEGDTFEMEDQRNWTDASYKTYCTPLDLAFPVEIAAGTPFSSRSG